MVDIEEKILEEDKVLNYDAYAPKTMFQYDDLSSLATVYRLNKKYTINEKTKIRFWEEQVYAIHISKNSKIRADTNIKMDDKGDLVFFA